MSKSTKRTTRPAQPKPEPQHRDPGGGRYIKPLCVSNDNHGGERIILVVTHLNLQQRKDALETLQALWEIERYQSQLARTAARNAAKGITA